MYEYELNGEDVVHMVHNHLNNKEKESNLIPNDDPSDADIKMARNHPKTLFFIYNQTNEKTQFFNEKGIYLEKPLFFFH